MFEGFKKKIVVGLTGLTMAGGMKAEATPNNVGVGDLKEKKEIKSDNSHAEKVKAIEAEVEKRRQELFKAENHLISLVAIYRSKLDQLQERHKDHKDLRKLLKGVEVLPEEVTSFVKQILSEKGEMMEDPEFIAKAPLGLRQAVLDASNPPGGKLINFSLALNQEVGDYSGQNSQDILERTELSTSLGDMAEAQWQVNFAQYLFDKSKKELESLKNKSEQDNTKEIFPKGEMGWSEEGK